MTLSPRRLFVTPVAVALACFAFAGPLAWPQDPPATHGMLVVGENPAFLLHLSMFQNPAALALNPPQLMPHRYQVILEASFSGPNEAHQAYVEDRRDHPDVTIYTVRPRPFVLPRLVADDPLEGFTADASRGHFEKGGAVILADVQVDVAHVIHFREFDLEAERPDHLEYLLFGSPDELFAAHVIVGPPDFDHVLRIESLSRELSEEELTAGVLLVFSEATNNPAARLEAHATATGMIPAASSEGDPEEITVEVGDELYFEEGELLLPPNFQSTELELTAGFP